MRQVFIKFYQDFLKTKKHPDLQFKPLMKMLQCFEDILIPKFRENYYINEVSLCYASIFNKLFLNNKKYDNNHYNSLAIKIFEMFSSNHLLNSFHLSIAHSIKSPNHLKTLLQEISKSSKIEENEKPNIIYNTIKSYLEKTLNPDKANFSNDLAIKCAISIWEFWKENALFTEQENVLEKLLTTFIISPLKIHFRKIKSLIENTGSNELFKSTYLQPLSKPDKSSINKNDFIALKNKLIEVLENPPN
jgi:hypothetical protein